MSQYDWLASDWGNTVFTVFDTETTGLDPKPNRVVEIGGLRFDARGIISRFNVLINPGMPMPAEASRINGITDAMLRDQPTMAEALPDFLRFAGDSVLIAHNAPFDISFIDEELSRLGKPALRNRVVDTRILAREVFPGLPKYSLQELALKFGIMAVDAHRAEDDARVCMELFLVCVAKLRERINPGANVGAVPGTPAGTPGAVPPGASVGMASGTGTQSPSPSGSQLKAADNDDMAAEADLFDDTYDELEED